MNKKFLLTLTIASIAIAGLFADYTSPSIILNADAPSTDYEFKLQKLNANLDDYEDLDSDYVEDVILTSEGGVTNAFAVATTANGNMPNEIAFEATVTTGEFKDLENSDFDTGLFPKVISLEDSATTENLKRGDEEVTYKSNKVGNFLSESSGTFTTTFSRGIHLFGTEIARFKLEYKDATNSGVAAGSYQSTTTITIATK